MKDEDKSLSRLNWELWFFRLWPFRVYRNIRDGIDKLWYWLPVIWNDRDWDHSFLFTLWEHKFRSMEDFFEKYGICVDSEEQAHQCRICAILCQRLAEDDYLDAYLVLNGNKTQIKKAFELEDKMIQQDLDLLSLMIKKYSRNWWD